VSNQEYQLTVRKGPKVGRVFYLDARSLIIGRDPMSDIIINDPEVSRQHARLTKIEDSFQIEDLGSTNGTFIEGKRLKSEPAILQSGQAINMGSGVRLVYEIVSERTSDVDTMIDPVQPRPVEELNTPEQLELNKNNDVEAEHFQEENFPPPFESPTPELYEYSERLVASPTSNPDFIEKDNRRRNVIIAGSVILLLCCCCGLIGFMYQWGGDWLLEYIGWY